MKKILSLLIVGIMTATMTLGCGKEDEVTNPTVADETTNVTTEVPTDGQTEVPTEEQTEAPTEAPTEGPTETPEVTDYGLADQTSEGAILHCWNWSYNNIKEHMKEIAQAGFSAVQTSPVQQAKDYTYNDKVYTNVGTPNGTGGSDGQWWKLYQPVTFNICDNGQSFLGTKDEFKKMCEEAEKYGVKVIVDVVANHLGNITGWKNSMSDITPQVGEYWKADMMTDETYWHINSIQCWMSDGRRDLTLGTIGMPDLNTADKRVQNMVLDFLKECVDCGADGFRFDAAKHIETPDDVAAIASDFWPTVINGIRDYADHELFIYGEILNTPGDNFSINNYTKYMSVTDSATGDNRRNDVRYKNASSAANPGYSYDASKCVVWNESHDTYVGAGSSYLATDTMIKQTWAIIAARKEATPLFLARSYYSEMLVDDKGNKKSTSSLVQTEMGDVGTMTFSDPSVAAVNNFKNAFIGQSEHVANKDSVVYIERGTTGAVIVNLNGAGTVNLKAYSMKNGTYTDRVSGNIFTVEDGFIKGEVTGADGIAVIYETETVPYAELSKQGGTLSEDKSEITITLKNATGGTYSIDGGTPVKFTGEVKVTVGDAIEYGESTMLTVTATDGQREYVYKHEYNKNQNENSAEKFDENSGKNHIYMKNTAGWEEVYCYMWTDDKKNNAGWPGLKMTELDDGTFLYATDTDFPNVIFNNGNGTQTADLKWPGNNSIYDNGKNKFEER